MPNSKPTILKTYIMTTPNKPQKSASAHKPTPAEMTAQLVSLLDVETLENNRYLGSRAEGATGRVFGGQVVGQALMAATKAVEADKTLHSLHAYFMRPGDNDLPITYQVERDYDGRSFGTRRVIAWQKDEPILNLAASFQRPKKV
ncbi:MAG: thioesterase family protein [Spongiibacteraceae bacterium]|nr:thioesterase family protein [Spongiibacteraceae bacterium]